MIRSYQMPVVGKKHKHPKKGPFGSPQPLAQLGVQLSPLSLSGSPPVLAPPESSAPWREQAMLLQQHAQLTPLVGGALGVNSLPPSLNISHAVPSMGAAPSLPSICVPGGEEAWRRRMMQRPPALRKRAPSTKARAKGRVRCHECSASKTQDA